MRYNNVELHNVCDIIEQPEQNCFQISRVPREILRDINDTARNMAGMSTGCEIRGILAEGGKARVVLQALDDNATPPIVTVYHGCFCGKSVFLGKEPVEIVIEEPQKIGLLSEISKGKNLAFDPRLVRIRLPHIHTVRVLSIEGDLSYPTPKSTPSKTLLAYGSSITHGASAIPPEGTYAAQCARRLGYDLINLGFGGSARMDPAIAQHIASRDDWDIATFEMGINVRQLPHTEFRTLVENFVGTVVAANPEKHIFCIDLFTYFCDFEVKPSQALGFREVVKEVAAKFGSEKVVYIDGRKMLADPAGLRTDLVHPSDSGMQEMGSNLASIIARHIE